MRIAVVIPFRSDPAILAWALEGFAAQQLPAGVELEVRLCGDGVPVPTPPQVTQPRITFSTVESPRVGISEAKNLLLRNRPADIVILANGDTRPAPDFARTHAETLLRQPDNSMVLGASPWEQSPAPTILDSLLSDTPMIFFYNQLIARHPYDFRHAWNLNVSVRYADLERIGFFNPLFRPYGFEDLDLAYRLMGASSNVYFEPAAQLLHRHPMTFDDYLNREELLGIMSPVLHLANRDVFKHFHGTDDLESLAAAFRAWTQIDLPSHAWIYRRMQEWNALPAASTPGPDRDRLLMTLYQMHVPLKRLAFRLGFIRGLELRDDAHWKDRKPVGLWKKAIGIHSP